MTPSLIFLARQSSKTQISCSKPVVAVKKVNVLKWSAQSPDLDLEVKRCLKNEK